MNLIYFPENHLKPSGGPAGYLYNLKEGLDAMGNDEIVFLPSKNTLVDKEKAKNIVPKRLLEFKKVLRFTRMYKEKTVPPVDFNEYETVHFHRTDDLYRCREALDGYHGKVLLTSHTPCIRFQELIDMLNPSDAKIFQKQLRTLEMIDEFAFKRADYIIFPCKEAEEPYYHTWNKYKNIRNENKYRYMPTGIIGCTAKIGREEYRKKYGIPDDAFVISYVGRHNEIKGYADLKKLGEELLTDKNVYFLIGGKEEPMTGLKNDHWIEVGWTNDPHSLIAAADVFVLPNHETYFDLILLEVLSLGVPVVMSRTGGNKYFEQFKQPGLKFYDDLNEAKNKILEIKQMPDCDLDKAKDGIRALFKQKFTVEQFAKNYVNIVSEIAAL